MDRYDQTTLIRALQNPALYSHPVTGFEVLETHISWVLLTGPFAYKIKKPVDLGFVDFSTLAKRQFYCHEEVRLNSRLAPDLYCNVIPISGSPDIPRLETLDPPFEYAVQMRQFAQDDRLDHVLQRGEVHANHILQLAGDIANFHARIPAADASTVFGQPDHVRQPVLECFAEFHGAVLNGLEHEQIPNLFAWTEQEWKAKQQEFTERKTRGFIRECHGDLHLQNMVMIKGRIVVFDCLEFNESLRWIDVISEIAFLCMDLTFRNRLDLASLFLNRYLELTGDYRGLAVFRFYETYRALVRAKVAAIRLAQARSGDPTQEKMKQECQEYFNLATRLIQSQHPILLITHGLSGSGKTTMTQKLLQHLGAVRLRSDVERKRLFGLVPHEPTPPSRVSELYSRETTDRIYHALSQLADILLRSGFPVIVDATFLRHQYRMDFVELARRLGVRFAILDFDAPVSELRRRLDSRKRSHADESDATVEILEGQLKTQEPLRPDERSWTVPISSYEQLAAVARTLDERYGLGR